MKKIKDLRTIQLILFMMLLGGCKTTYEVVDAPPSWIVSPPVSDGHVWYFYAEGVSSDEEESRYAAVDILYSNILAAMGLRQEDIAAMPEPAKQFFNGLRNDIIRATLFPGASSFPGYSALDRAVMTDQSAMVHVYYLSAFSEEGFAQLKRKVSRYWWFEDPLVSGLEQKARDRVAAGDIYGGIEFYLEAAMTGYESGGRISDILFLRNAEKAEELVSRLILEKGTTPVSVMGMEYQQPFLAFVRDSATGTGQQRVPLSGTFSEMDRSGVMRTRTARVVSSKEGRVNFFPPAPNFYGEAEITLSLGDSFLPRDASFPPYVSAALDRMRASLRGKSVSYAYVTTFDPKKIPTGLLILDTDIVKKPLKELISENVILQELQSAGYLVTVMDLGPEVLLKKKDAELIRDLRTVYAGKYERIIYGVCSVTGFKSENGLNVVEVKAVFSVLDLKRGTVLYSREIIKTASAKDSQQALGTAFMLTSKAFAQYYLTQP